MPSSTAQILAPETVRKVIFVYISFHVVAVIFLAMVIRFSHDDSIHHID